MQNRGQVDPEEAYEHRCIGMPILKSKILGNAQYYCKNYHCKVSRRVLSKFVQKTFATTCDGNLFPGKMEVQLFKE